MTQYEEAGGALQRQVVVHPDAPAAAFLGVADIAASGTLVYFTVPGGAGFAANGFFAADLNSAAVVWSGFGNRTYAISPNVAVSVNQDRTLLNVEGLNPANGNKLWGPFVSGPSPALANRVVLTSLQGALQARDLESGAVVGTFTPSQDTPIGLVTPANGRIYVGSSQRLSALAPHQG